MPIIGTQGYCPLVRSTQFPVVLSTGAIARYPMARQRRYATKQIDFADFSRQTAPLLNSPLMNWDITLSQLTDAEFAAIAQFFDLQKGSYGTFTFVDPWDNLLQYSEQFGNAAWNIGSNMLIGQNYLANSQDFENWSLSNTGSSNPSVTPDAQTAPDGTTTADTIAFPSVPNTTGDNSYIYNKSTPPTTASMTFTFSVWLRVASGTASINIEANDFVSQSSTTTCNLTTSWQRFYTTVTFNSSPSGNVFGVIVNPQNSAAVSVGAWGAQLEYGAAPSDYTATTALSAPLQIADPFFVPAIPSFPGYQWNLNSAYPKRAIQVVITNTSNPYIKQSVAVAPAGMNFTASIYTKAQDEAPPILPFGLYDSAFVDGITALIQPAGSWSRTTISHRFSNSNSQGSMVFQVGGGTPATGVFYLFGAQMEAEGVASAYKMTEGICGVHPTCYINTDEYAHIASEFDVNVFENSMRQRRSTLSQLSDVLSISECNPS